MDPARASSSSHAAERRQRLEHELSLLQADVATLCTKLTKSPFEDDDEGPAPAAAARKTPGLDGGEDRVMKVSARARQKRDDDDDANGADSVDGAPATAGKAPKGTEARLRRSLEAMTRRRDAADCDVKRLKLEADKLRARADKYAELQRAHAGLQLDYAALRASLEASERIRMKQKELLQLVERNNGEERASPGRRNADAPRGRLSDATPRTRGRRKRGVGWTTALGARRGAQLADGLRDGDAIDDVLRDGYDDFDDAGDDLRQPPHADDGVGTPDLVSTASSLIDESSPTHHVLAYQTVSMHHTLNGAARPAGRPAAKKSAAKAQGRAAAAKKPVAPAAAARKVAKRVSAAPATASSASLWKKLPSRGPAEPGKRPSSAPRPLLKRASAPSAAALAKTPALRGRPATAPVSTSATDRRRPASAKPAAPRPSAVAAPPRPRPGTAPPPNGAAKKPTAVRATPPKRSAPSSKSKYGV